MDAGLKPACVLACPTGAITFGNLNDPASEIAKAIAKNPVQAIKPDMGTEPQTFYIGLDQSAVEAKKVKEE